MNRRFIFNLSLFPDDDDDFNLDNLDDDDNNDDDNNDDDNNDDGKDKKDKKDWYLPGKHKTKEDFLKAQKKTDQYIKQLETQNKEYKKKPEPAVAPTPQKPETMSAYKKAATELGITNDDMLIDPIGANEKIHTYLADKRQAEVNQTVNNSIGSVRSAIIMDKLKQQYPNFDIVKYEKKVGAIAMRRHNTAYINEDPEKVFGKIIEELGGKKRKSGEPYSETPTSGAGSSKKKTTEADQIRAGMKSAPGSSADIFK